MIITSVTLCLWMSRAQNPPWACHRSKKASSVMLGLLPSHPWAQPGHKDKGCAGVGASQMASQGLQKVVGRRLLPALGVPGQPSLALEQGTCPGLCMGLAQL